MPRYCLLAFLLMIAPVAAAEDRPIRLGHYGSMSGANASFGESTDRSIRLAVEQANARGGVLGRKIEVFTEDDQTKPDQVIPSVLALIDGKKVDVVLGEVSSSLSLIGAPRCQDRKVPMVTPSSAAAAITKVGDYIFRMCYVGDYQGKAAAVVCVRDIKAGRAALLIDQKSDYSVGVARAFRENFAAMGGKIVAEMSYLQGDKDFKSQLSAIGDARPDVILIPAMYGDMPGIARQARGLGIAVPLVGGDGWDSPDLVRDGGKDLEGCFFLSHYAPDDPGATVRDYQAAYRKLYNGQEPDGMGALAYDAAWVVLDAIRRAGSTEPQAIRDALATTEGFAGITGTITMGADRNPSKSAMVIQIRSGSFRKFGTVEASDAASQFIATTPDAPIIEARTSLAQPLINGLSLGAIYGLIALGYTIVYGILRWINFAHGDLVMIAPLIIFGVEIPLLNLLQMPGGSVVAMLATLSLAMFACGCGGLMLERVAYRPLRRPYALRTIAVVAVVVPAVFEAVSYGIARKRPDLAALAHVAAIGTNLYGLALWLNAFADRRGVKTPGRLVPLITAIGVSLFLESAPQQRGLFGNRHQSFPDSLVANVLGTGANGGRADPIRIGGVIVDRVDLLVLVVTFALLIGLVLIVKRTRMGLAMRAVSDNPDSAALMGIDVDRVIRFSFALGGALAGAAGVLWATKYPTIDPLMGVSPGLKAFVAAVIGGIGSLPGAVLGGLVLGVSESFLASGPLSQFKEALAFLLLIAILLARPAGLLGRNLPEKV